MAYNKKILVIDDDEDIRKTFRTVLTRQGIEMPQASKDIDRLASLDELNDLANSIVLVRFEPDFAGQGQEGLEKVKKAKEEGHPYAVVFLDIRMPPGWNGVQTAREILLVDPHIQIVIVTAYSDYSVAEMTSQIGYPDRLFYLKKPFDDEEILQLADSLSTRWNIETKTRGFLRLFENFLGRFQTILRSGPIDKAELSDLYADILQDVESIIGRENIPTKFFDFPAITNRPGGESAESKTEEG